MMLMRNESSSVMRHGNGVGLHIMVSVKERWLGTNGFVCLIESASDNRSTLSHWRKRLPSGSADRCHIACYTLPMSILCDSESRQSDCQCYLSWRRVKIADGNLERRLLATFVSIWAGAAWLPSTVSRPVRWIMMTWQLLDRYPLQ